MQVGRVGERAQPVHDRRRRVLVGRDRDVERGAELHAADLDARVANPFQRRARRPRTRPRSGSSRSRRGCARAGSRDAADSETCSARASCGAPLGSRRRSKNSRVSAVFSSEQSGSGSISRWRSVPVSWWICASLSATRTTLRVIVSQPSLVGRSHPRLVGKRCGRHAAVDGLGHERLQDANQVERVGHPRGIAPVGRVDAGLHRRAVERPVWKAVDHGDVQPLVVEQLAELGQVGAGEEPGRIACRQPQPDAER